MTLRKVANCEDLSFLREEAVEKVPVRVKRLKWIPVFTGMANFFGAKVCYYEQKERRSTLPSVIPAEAGIHCVVFQQPLSRE